MLSPRFRFRHVEVVRFRDLDSLGHVNNAVYLTYFESARIAYWLHTTKRTGLSALDMILARAEIDFRSPLAYGESVEYRVQAPRGATIIRAMTVSTNLFDVLGIPFHPAGSWTDGRGETIHSLAILDGPLPDALGAASADLVGRSFALDQTGHVQVVALLAPAFLFPTPRTTRRPQALTPPRFTTRSLDAWPNRTSPAWRDSHPASLPKPRRRARRHHAARRRRDRATARRRDDQPTARMALGALAAGLPSRSRAANVVNLMVARGIYRTREFATREAIGARRSDIVRVLLEVTALAIAATAGSLVLGSFALQLISKVIPDQ